MDVVTHQWCILMPLLKNGCLHLITYLIRCLCLFSSISFSLEDLQNFHWLNNYKLLEMRVLPSLSSSSPLEPPHLKVSVSKVTFIYWNFLRSSLLRVARLIFQSKGLSNFFINAHREIWTKNLCLLNLIWNLQTWEKRQLYLFKLSSTWRNWNHMRWLK